GYLLLAFAPIAPKDSWHWLPYLAYLGSLDFAFEISPSFLGKPFWIGRVAVALVTAWLLVPVWPSLAATQPLWRACIALFIMIVWAVLDRGSVKQPAALLLGQLFLVAIC